MAAGFRILPHARQTGPGEISVAVAIDRMVIEPGDLMLGDDDGLLCVPLVEIDAVQAVVSHKAATEARRMANIEAGTHHASRVDAALRRLGCGGLA